jgi:hypothetical protein
MFGCIVASLAPRQKRQLRSVSSGWVALATIFRAGHVRTFAV